MGTCFLYSVGTDGRVYVWKITEGPDDEDKPQITANIVIAVQIVGEEKVEHPQICWHCHKQVIASYSPISLFSFPKTRSNGLPFFLVYVCVYIYIYYINSTFSYRRF